MSAGHDRGAALVRGAGVRGRKSAPPARSRLDGNHDSSGGDDPGGGPATQTCVAAANRSAYKITMTNSRAFDWSYPMTMARLSIDSWETIFHRSIMMANGTCSPAEYQRMVTEKAAAMQASTVALMTGRGQAAVLAPFLVRARRNAKRLRKTP